MQKKNVFDVLAERGFVKQSTDEVALNKFLGPIRQRRKEFESQPDLVENIIKQGTKKARKEASQTLLLVKEAMGLKYF